jgi:hypothetical protein
MDAQVGCRLIVPKKFDHCCALVKCILLQVNVMIRGDTWILLDVMFRRFVSYLLTHFCFDYQSQVQSEFYEILYHQNPVLLLTKVLHSKSFVKVVILLG